MAWDNVERQEVLRLKQEIKNKDFRLKALINTAYSLNVLVWVLGVIVLLETAVIVLK